MGADGKYHALWHAFALPQIGAYWYAGGGCANTTGTKPCFASLAIDHSGPGSFVAAEHTERGGGRIVRWPLDESTGLPRSTAGVVQAIEAFDSPVWGMQGAVSYGGKFVIRGGLPGVRRQHRRRHRLPELPAPRRRRHVDHDLDEGPQEHREPLLLARHQRTLAPQRTTPGTGHRPHPLELNPYCAIGLDRGL